MERNSYHSIAKMKFNKTNDLEFIDMGYSPEEENATDTFEMHFIELEKFKIKNPECSTKLEQWLWLIDGSKEDKIKMSAEENKEINKAVEELDKLSQDPKEREKYEEREWSIMRYNAEMETNREIGEKIGEERGKKTEKMKMIKKLFEKNMKIDEIAEIVELNVEEVKSILENKK